MYAPSATSAIHRATLRVVHDLSSAAPLGLAERRSRPHGMPDRDVTRVCDGAERGGDGRLESQPHLLPAVPAHGHAEADQLLEVVSEEAHQVEFHGERQDLPLAGRDEALILKNPIDRLHVIEQECPVHAHQARRSGVVRGILSTDAHYEAERHLPRGEGCRDTGIGGGGNLIGRLEVIEPRSRQVNVIDPVDLEADLTQGGDLLQRGTAADAERHQKKTDEQESESHRYRRKVELMPSNQHRAALPNLYMRKLKPQEVERPARSALESLRRHPIVVVLDDLRSAYNVGAIFRTADALLVERIVCCGYTPTPDNLAVAKTALGAECAVPWDHAESAAEAIISLRAAGVTIAALEQTDESVSVAAARPEHFPLALVLGNEVSGVDQRVLDLCDLAFEIPQYGSKTSLNVAVAFGVAGYGLMCQLPHAETK
jgi:23S rRNA (guanosine2251-2'-O)-methyltransferase